MRTKTLNIPEFNENKYYLINEEVKSPVYVVKVKNDKLEYLFGCREDFIKSNQVKEFKEEEWFLGIIEDNPLNITIDDISTLVIEIASRDDIDLSKLPYTEYDLAVALIMKDMSVSDVNQTNLSKIFEWKWNLTSWANQDVIILSLLRRKGREESKCSLF